MAFIRERMETLVTKTGNAVRGAGIEDSTGIRFGACKMLIRPSSGESRRQETVLVWSTGRGLGWYDVLGDHQQ